MDKTTSPSVERAVRVPPSDGRATPRRRQFVIELDVNCGKWSREMEDTAISELEDLAAGRRSVVVLPAGWRLLEIA